LKTGGWARVAFAMFAVGWGANQFSPILIVYRHELHLDAGTLANLFAIYAAALIPGLLAGGPLSDRFGRRRVVIPFAVLSPVATLIWCSRHTRSPRSSRVAHSPGCAPASCSAPRPPGSESSRPTWRSAHGGRRWR